MRIGVGLRLLVLVVFVFALSWSYGAAGAGPRASADQSAEANPCSIPKKDPCSYPLPNPSGMKLSEYRCLLYEFLQNRCYLNWVGDREIRNTGPVIWDNATNKIKSYGTHPTVRVYYSPEAWKWMKEDERRGEIPDGAMIVKEMYNPPATEGAAPTSWTVMVKDKNGSWDGWFWDGFSVDSPPDPAKPVLSFESGFGAYCVRCHASAAGGTSTFSAVKNVEEDPVIYRVNVPSMLPLEVTTHEPGIHDKVRALAKSVTAGPGPESLPGFSADFVFPNQQFYDHAPAGPKGPEQFLTSDQCMGCHSATPNDMLYLFPEPDRTPVNLSPFTEWQSSMMGLAGRDPVFHSQVESERAQFPDKSAFLDDKCFSCHGVMGQRQLHIDQDIAFSHDMVYATPDPAGPLSKYAKYGGLARDGVSCTVCHHIAAEGLGQPSSFTGNFKVDPARTINGPYTDVVELPMKNALGITPRPAPQIKSSALCGSCHVVITPTFDKAGKQVGTFHEQTTYLEWLNSDYQNEPDISRRQVVKAEVKTCQDCHMPRKYKGDDRPLTFRIANIQDTTYPFSDNLAPYKDLALKLRDTYSRHTLVGLNVFVNQMFQQFSSNPTIPSLPNILGLVSGDYMYADSVMGLKTTEKAMLELAHDETAQMEILSAKKAGEFLEVEVKVTNLAGHSFPTGVEFRRAFLELKVLDGGGNPVWASGMTDSQGRIVQGLTATVLPTEFFWDAATNKQVFQPHFDKNNPITRDDQVQIYEELVADTEGKITTSFVTLSKHVKDNRLLPKGWRQDVPAAKHTAPFGRAEQDPGYVNRVNNKGSEGSNTVLYRVRLGDLKGQPASVSAQLNYQAIPPYYLKDRFSVLERKLPPDKTRETRRLKFFYDNLKVEKVMEDWKLRIIHKTRALDN